MADKIYLATKENVESLGSQIEPIVQDYLDDCYTVIQEKGGTVPEVKNLRNLETSIRSIYDHMDEVLDGSTDTVTTDATSIRGYAFYAYSNLKKVIAPNALTIGDYAFFRTGIMDTKNVECPSMREISPYSFSECQFLTIDDDRIVHINANGFLSCPFLTSVNLPNCEIIGNDGLRGCLNLTSINLPKCEKITARGLATTKLVEVNFPVLTHLGFAMFNGCNNLKRVVIGSDIFQSDTEGAPFQGANILESVEFPNMGVDYVFSNSGIRSNLVTTCVITCSDGTIEYINGAWTIVRD